MKNIIFPSFIWFSLVEEKGNHTFQGSALAFFPHQYSGKKEVHYTLSMPDYGLFPLREKSVTSGQPGTTDNQRVVYLFFLFVWCDINSKVMVDMLVRVITAHSNLYILYIQTWKSQ